MDPFSAVASIIGSGINYMGQQETNKMQQQMMQQQQSFQERMSSTAYQRASSDMTSAGLNPMMMFSQGSAASSPSGATPSQNVKSGLDGDTVAKFLSTATQMRVADATIESLTQQAAKYKAEALTEHMRPTLVVEQTKGVKADTRNKEDSNPIIRNTAVTSKNEMGIDPKVRKLADQLGYGGKKVNEILSPVSSIVGSAKGVNQIFNDRFGHW